MAQTLGQILDDEKKKKLKTAEVQTPVPAEAAKPQSEVDRLSALIRDLEQPENKEFDWKKVLAPAALTIAGRLLGGSQGGASGARIGSKLIRDEQDKKSKARERQRLGLLDELKFARDTQNKKDLEKMRFDEESKRLERQRKEKMQDAKELETFKVGLQGTDADRAVDREMAKRYDNFILGGGSESVVKNLSLLESVLDSISTETADGRIQLKRGAEDLTRNPSDFFATITGIESAREAFNPKGVEVQQKIQAAIQNTLRPILGGNFAAIEGQQIMDRAWNPRAPIEDNIQRVRAEAKSLARRLQQQMAAFDYFEKNKTMRGYQGMPMLNQNVMTAGSGPGPVPAPQGQPLSVLPEAYANDGSQILFNKQTGKRIRIYPDGTGEEID